MANNFDSLVECAICQEVMERPKLLLCAHSFCMECLQLMAKTQNVIKCPSCRENTPVPPQGIAHLRDDFRVEQLKSLCNSRKKGTPMCELCLKFEVTTYCMQCHKKMCLKCLHTHSKITSMHTVLRVDDLKRCPKHGEYCGFVCGDCLDLVCTNCRLGLCSTHDCVDIGEAARTHLTSDSDVVAKMEDIYTDLWSEKNWILSHVKRQITDHADRLIDAIHLRTNQLCSILSTVDDELQGMIAPMEENGMELATSLRGIQPSCLQSGIPSAFLKLLPTLHAGELPESTAIMNVKFIEVNGLGLGELRCFDYVDRLADAYGDYSPDGPPDPPLGTESPDTPSGGKVDPDAPDTKAEPMSCSEAMRLEEECCSAEASPEPTKPPTRGPAKKITFSKVVRDTRKGKNGYMASYMEDIIVRLDYQGQSETRFTLVIFERDVHPGYYGLRNFVRRWPCVKQLEKYSGKVKLMAGKVKQYISNKS